MAKVTWLGEDGPNVAGPSFTTAFDRKFPKGEAVEVADERILVRARKNQFFSVDDEPKNKGGRPRKVIDVANEG